MSKLCIHTSNNSGFAVKVDDEILVTKWIFSSGSKTRIVGLELYTDKKNIVEILWDDTTKRKGLINDDEICGKFNA